MQRRLNEQQLKCVLSYLLRESEQLRLPGGTGVTGDPAKGLLHPFLRRVAQEFPVVARYSEATGIPVIPLLNLWKEIERAHSSDAVHSPTLRFLRVVREFREAVQSATQRRKQSVASAVDSVQDGGSPQKTVESLVRSWQK